ncbi:MAG: hypothetical protein KC496_03340 [Anaerolineae bacterium]|nr:hypothetical protein [Anaerolineae bacterium]
MIEMAIAGEIDKPDIVIFSDTGDEPWWVYDYAMYIARKCQKAGIRFYCTSWGNKQIGDGRHNIVGIVVGARQDE